MKLFGVSIMEHTKTEWIDDHTLKISGLIDETSSFDDLLKNLPPEVWIDFQDVTRINSCGVREWIKAILNTESKIHLINCSSIVASQFFMIPEFLGPNGVVDSFETPFICENCDHEIQKILELKDIKSESELTDLEETCPKCGETMELDQDPDIYIEFLQRMLQKTKAG